MIKSEIDPLAAFSKTSPIKTTVLWAVASSKHGTIVVGSLSLFCSKRPFKACWRIYLSDNSGRSIEEPKIECP